MFIFSNLAMSLDGKIATQQRTFFPLGTPEDLRQMQVLRKACDAVLMGASTLRVYKKPCVIDAPPGIQIRQPINILVSSALDQISPTWPFFKNPMIRRIIFVGSKTPLAKRKLFSKTSEVIVLKQPTARNPIAKQITQQLKTRQIKRLLVEGGGEIMWDFVSQGLLDEYHVTLTPKIIGGAHAPTLVDGAGFRPQDVVSLQLRQCRVLGEEIYLTYSRKK